MTQSRSRDEDNNIIISRKRWAPHISVTPTSCVRSVEWCQVHSELGECQVDGKKRMARSWVGLNHPGCDWVPVDVGVGAGLLTLGVVRGSLRDLLILIWPGRQRAGWHYNTPNTLSPATDTALTDGKPYGLPWWFPAVIVVRWWQKLAVFSLQWCHCPPIM